MREYIPADHENTLAVRATWGAMLMPWSVTYVPLADSPVSFIYARWGPGQYRHVLGRGDDALMTLPGAISYQQGTTLQTGYTVWAVASAVALLTLIASIALFAREEQLDERFGRPGRYLGGLLVGSGLGYLGAIVAIYLTGPPGAPLPIGALFMIIFGAMLVFNQPGGGTEPEPGENAGIIL